MDCKRKGPASPSDYSSSYASPPKRPRISSDATDDAKQTAIYDENEKIYIFQSQVEDEGETGIIEEISLKNFMCHSKLVLKLGPNVNFITGSNGSGKSALLNAVVVGLGGRTIATNHGTNVTNFIKSGKKFAEVSITLRNEGPNSYRPTIYGNKITVVRSISYDGQSKYKLKNIRGTVISERREELLNLLDAFNIQIDNPVCVLNQEISKNFLHSKSPHDKYKFFIKATQLGQMDRDYSMADNDKRVAEEILRNKVLGIKEIEKEVRALEKNYNIQKHFGKLHERLDIVKNEAMWSQIIAREKELDQIATNLENEKMTESGLKRKIKEAVKKTEKAENLLHETQKNLNKITENMKELIPCQEARNAELVNYKEQLRIIASEYSKVKIDGEHLTSDIAIKKNDLRNMDQNDESHEKRRKLMETHSKSLMNLKTLKNELTDSHNKLQNSTVEYKIKIDKKTNGLNQVKLEVERKKKDLKNLLQSRNNNILKFGSWVNALKLKIDAACARRKFKRRPIGPIGAFVSLKDPKWTLAVEICIGDLIRAYCVDNLHDEKLLMELMKETIRDRRPKILTSPFTNKIFDVSRNKSNHKQHPTVFDVLDFKNPTIANALIDNCSIENVLLVIDNEEARQLMSKNPPRNCRLCYTIRGDKVFPRSSYRYYAAKPNRQARYLEASVETLIKNIEEEISHLEKKVTAKEMKLDEIQNQNDREGKELKSIKNQLDTLEVSIRKSKDKLRELKDLDECMEPAGATKLEQEINDMEDVLIENKSKCDELNSEMCKLKEHINNHGDAMKEINEKMEEIETTKTFPLNKILVFAQNEIANAEKERKGCEDCLTDHKKKVEEIEAKRDEMMSIIETMILKASRVCPRINTKRNPLTIDNEITHIHRTIEKGERSHGDRAEATRKFYDAQKKLVNLKKMIEDLNTFIMNLTEVLRKRRCNYRVFRALLALRANSEFVVILNQQSLTGKLEFDHKRELLQIRARGEKREEFYESEDMRALSGGERSFSTVAFLLALWETVESPFHFLDEFDVFMDMFTRRRSFDLLLAATAKKTSCQFCLLTPLKMPPIKHEHMKIFKMPEPERGSQSSKSVSTWEADSDSD